MIRNQAVPFDSAVVIELHQYRNIKTLIDRQKALCDSTTAQCQANIQVQQQLTVAFGQQKYSEGQRSQNGFKIATVALGLLELLRVIQTFAK